MRLIASIAGLAMTEKICHCHCRYRVAQKLGGLSPRKVRHREGTGAKNECAIKIFHFISPIVL
jgi:hypothetical protein